MLQLKHTLPEGLYIPNMFRRGNTVSPLMRFSSLPPVWVRRCRGVTLHGACVVCWAGHNSVVVTLALDPGYLAGGDKTALRYKHGGEMKVMGQVREIPGVSGLENCLMGYFTESGMREGGKAGRNCRERDAGFRKPYASRCRQRRSPVGKYEATVENPLKENRKYPLMARIRYHQALILYPFSYGTLLRPGVQTTVIRHLWPNNDLTMSCDPEDRQALADPPQVRWIIWPRRAQAARDIRAGWRAADSWCDASRADRLRQLGARRGWCRLVPRALPTPPSHSGIYRRAR